MSGGDPPRRVDPRREDDDDDDEAPTDDVTDALPVEARRPPVPRPSLRLQIPRIYDEATGMHEETDVIPSPVNRPRRVAAAALPREITAWLDVVDSPAGPSRFEVTMVRMTVGRGLEADIRVGDRALSRKHATIFYNGDEFRIRDEGTKNGTLLNGSPVVEYALRDGDEVVVGKTRFVFHTTERNA